MFKIELELETDVESMFGLAALDERRRLKLPDDSKLRFDQTTASRWVEVDEAFARLYFPRNVANATAVIPLAALAAGDLVPLNGLPGCVKWADDDTLTDDRVMQLFAAYKPA